METTQFYLQELLEIVVKRWKLIAFFAVMVVAIVTLGTLRQPKIYKASTIVEVGAETPDIAFYKEVISDYPQNWWTIQTYYETQYRIITSRYMLGLVAQKIFDQKLIPDSQQQTILTWLQGAVSVKPQDKSRLVTISVEDTIPERAARISDLVADVYSEDNLNRKLSGAKGAVENISKQLDVYRGAKEKSDNVLQKFKEENRIVSLENKQNIAKENIIALNEALTTVKNDRIVIEAKYKTLERILEESKTPEELYGAVDSEMMKKLKMDYDSMMRQWGELSSRYKEKHPQMVEIKTGMDETANAIKREAKAEVSKLKNQYLLAKAQEDSVLLNLEKQKDEAIKLDSLILKMEMLSSDQSTNMSFYEGLMKKLKEADLTGLIKSNNIRVMDKAVVPVSPVKPNVRNNILMALVFGLLGGIGLAYFIESLDNSIKSEEEVERYAKAPLLGVIPFCGTKNGEPGGINIELAPIKEPNSKISEMYRSVRTNLAFISSTNNYKVFQITSAGAQDGKTTTAVNLAASISQTGSKVLIIDLDLRKSRVSATLGIDRERGLTDYLVNSIDIWACIKSSGIPNFDVITTGTLPPNPAELIGSPRLKEAIHMLRAAYDVIIIDSSPIVPVTDSMLIAQIVDGVILVVGAEKTGKHILRNSREQLVKVKANILGAILNGINLEKKKYLGKYYGYGYYKYGYTYGYPTDKTTEKETEKRVDA
jgi:polysaccharide biosynthesis transport protein